MVLTSNQEILDPIMGMVVPTSATPGEQYADDIRDDLALRIAPHRHTGVENLDGYQLDADALNLTQDIQMNDTNLGSTRSVQFQSQPAVLTGVSDVNDLYFVNGDAYINDGTGTPIRITQNGAVSLNAQFLSYTIGEIAANLVIPSNASYNLVNCDTQFNVIGITLPILNTVPSGRYFIIQDNNNNANTNNITVQIAGGSGNIISANGTTGSSIVLNGNGQSILFVSNGGNNWNASIFGQLFYSGQTLTYNNCLVNYENSTVITNDGFTDYFNSTMNFTGTNTINGNINIVGALVGTVSGSFSPTIANGVDGTVANAISTHITGGISSQNASGGIALNGGSNDWPTFGVAGASPRTKSINFPLIPQGALNGAWTAQINEPNIIGGATTDVQCFPLTVVHNGATLDNVVVFFGVDDAHAGGVPANFPTFSVLRSQFQANDITPTILSLSTNNNILNGSPSFPVTGAAWYNDGFQQGLGLVCNQNNVIDTTKYIYYILLVDENGTNSHANNTYLGVQTNYTNITSLKFST